MDLSQDATLFAAPTPGKGEDRHESAEQAEVIGRLLTTAAMLLARLTTMAQTHNLSLAAFNVLDLLSTERKALPPRAISQRLLIPAQTMTSILDSLESAGLVRRDANPRDRRSILIHVTDAGYALLDQVCPAISEFERTWTSILEPDEQKTFVEILHKLQTRLSEMPAAADT